MISGYSFQIALKFGKRLDSTAKSQSDTSIFENFGFSQEVIPRFICFVVVSLFNKQSIFDACVTSL